MPTQDSIALLHDLSARILDGSPDAILICDHAGTVRYWNAAAPRPPLGRLAGDDEDGGHPLR
jgi:hypothetical protein